MDSVWYQRHRAEGGTASFRDWEFQTVNGFENAPAPAKVGQALARKVHIEIPDGKAGLTNNVVHWTTGISWGVVAAMLRPLPRVGAIKSGLIVGVASWSTSYAVLPKLGVYKPITEYDAKTLWKDLSAHLVFGSVVGAASLAFGGVRAMLRR